MAGRGHAVGVRPRQGRDRRHRRTGRSAPSTPATATRWTSTSSRSRRSGDALFTVYSPIMVHLPGTPAGTALAAARRDRAGGRRPHRAGRVGVALLRPHPARGLLRHARRTAPPTTRTTSTRSSRCRAAACSSRPATPRRSTRSTAASGRIVLDARRQGERLPARPRRAVLVPARRADAAQRDRISLFDDEAGPPQKAPSSRGPGPRSSTTRQRTATVVQQYYRSQRHLGPERGQRADAARRQRVRRLRRASRSSRSSRRAAACCSTPACPRTTAATAPAAYRWQRDAQDAARRSRLQRTGPSSVVASTRAGTARRPSSAGRCSRARRRTSFARSTRPAPPASRPRSTPTGRVRCTPSARSTPTDTFSPPRKPWPPRERRGSLRGSRNGASAGGASASASAASTSSSATGPGPPLLLLHGFPSSSYDWRGLLALRPEPRRARLRLPRLRPLREAARPRLHARLAGRPGRGAGAARTARRRRSSSSPTTWGRRSRPS